MFITYRRGGALLSDEPIDGWTHEMPENVQVLYGARFMIAESMTVETAKSIAAHLGVELEVRT